MRSDATLLGPNDFASLGRGLNRPECVLTHRSGYLFVPDWTGHGGVAVVAPDGAVRRVLARAPLADGPCRPNGIALEADGSMLFAHLGAERGGLFRLWPDGTVEPVLTEIDGRPLPPSNFVLRDATGRLWLTVSTRVRPRADDYRPDAASGLVIAIDRRGPRIVADGLGYTNECAVSADERFLFVNETFGRRTTRFEIAPDGTLRAPAVVARYGAGTFPDGVALDVEGGLWITSIVSNRVIRVMPDGTHRLVVEDADAHHLAAVEAAFLAGAMGRPHVDTVKSRHLRNVSALAFGGADLRTAYLGSLLGEAIPSFRAPVAGLPPIHFDHDLTPLLAAGDPP